MPQVLMDWHAVLGALAGIITMLAVIPYIKDIVRGTTRPNVFTWLLWDTMLVIAFLAQLSAGASFSALMLFGDIVGTSLVLLLCFVGYSYGKYGWTEAICTTLAVVAIIAWQFADQPVLAIGLAILADALAAIPTLRKAFLDPWSEAPGQYLLIAFASILAVASTTIFDAANIIFPAYLLLVNGSIGTLAFFGRRLRPKSDTVQ